jgi:hypothetical protein
MFDQVAQETLKDRADYELWLLDFLSEKGGLVEGGTDVSTFTYDFTVSGRSPPVLVEVLARESLCSGAIMEILDAMRPLTFTASYKILDVIAEWILEENRNVGTIPMVPWRFSDKVEAIKSQQVVHPPFFQSHNRVRDCFISLYDNLLRFRNEIVHRHEFQMVDRKLVVKVTENGKTYVLELDYDRLAAFVRTSIALVKILDGTLVLGEFEEQCLNYHLDRIEELHGKGTSGQKKPVIVNVVLKVPIAEGKGSVNLALVRQRLSRNFPDASVLLNLRIVGFVDGTPSIAWSFPTDCVPEGDSFELQQNSYEEYQVSPQTISS